MEPETTAAPAASTVRAGARRARRRNPGRMVALVPAFILAAIIGALDVLVLESVWLSSAQLFVASFFVAWFVPSRWLTVAATMTAVMWAAYLIVRCPWWPHPQEVGPHAGAALFVAVPALFGAVFAGQIQVIRGKL